MSNSKSLTTKTPVAASPPATHTPASSIHAGCPSTPPFKTNPTQVETPLQEPSPHPDAPFLSFFYATHAGTLEEKNVNGRMVKLFTLTVRNFENDNYLFQIWGENAEQYYIFFQTCVPALTKRLFQLQNTDDIPESDATTLILKPFPPKSLFEKDVVTVFKLGTKSNNGPTQNRKLSAKSFPKMVGWKENTFFLSDGTPLPHPDTWLEDKVTVNLTNLYDIYDMEVAGPKKRQKK